MLKKCIPLLFFFATTSSFSWTVSKLSREICKNKDREYTVTVKSKDTESIPIEVYIGTLSIDEEGKESYERIDEHDFFIYPPIFVLQPGRVQKVRVRWTGNVDELKEEQAFRIGVMELPTKPKLSEVQEGVNIGLKFRKNFMGTIFVAPKNAKSHISMSKPLVTKKDNSDIASLTLTNEGNKRKTFKKPLCKMTYKEKSISFSPNFDSSIILLTGQKRTLELPLPEGWQEILGTDKDFQLSLVDAQD